MVGPLRVIAVPWKTPEEMDEREASRENARRLVYAMVDGLICLLRDVEGREVRVCGLVYKKNSEFLEVGK